MGRLKIEGISPFPPFDDGSNCRTNIPSYLFSPSPSPSIAAAFLIDGCGEGEGLFRGTGIAKFLMILRSVVAPSLYLSHSSIPNATTERRIIKNFANVKRLKGIKDFNLHFRLISNNPLELEGEEEEWKNDCWKSIENGEGVLTESKAI